MTSGLERLQLDIAARLESVDAFATVPITVIRPRTAEEATLIQTRLDQTLAGLVQKAGKSGAAIIVQMPTADVPEANVPGPQLEVTVQVRVLENPLINMNAAAGTLRSAEQIALDILAALHHFDPGTSGCPLFADKRSIEPVLDFPGKVAYDVNIRTRLGAVPEPKCQGVTFSKSGSLPTVEVTLTTPESGAEIRYTVDGSFPGPTAALYEDPFIQATAATIRAAAYAEGKQGSDISETTI
jgi:hypothetical protein